MQQPEHQSGTRCATCLTIAGSDSGGGAGIQADIKTISAYGVYATSVITAVTAQNTCEVLHITPIPIEAIKLQIRAVLNDIQTNAIKVGMLHTAEVIQAVFEEIKGKNIPIVLDPVMISKSKVNLLEPTAI